MQDSRIENARPEDNVASSAVECGLDERSSERPPKGVADELHDHNRSVVDSNQDRTTDTALLMGGRAKPGVAVRLAETFVSVQGEGSESGVPMFFARLAGCSVTDCFLHPANSGLCDTNWSGKETVACESVIDRVPSGIHWLCITGGEPTDQMQAVEALSRIAHRRNMRVMLQTSGVREVPDIFDWLVVSPKVAPMDLKQTRGHELKLVYTGQDYAVLRSYFYFTQFHRYYLMPLWGPEGMTNAKATADACVIAANCGTPWRFTLQGHKLAGVR